MSCANAFVILFRKNVIQSINLNLKVKALWEYLKNFIIWVLTDKLISGGDSAYLLNVVFIRPFLRTNNLWKSWYIAKTSNSPYYKKENVVQNPDKPNFVQHFSVKSVCIPHTRILSNHKSEFHKEREIL